MMVISGRYLCESSTSTLALWPWPDLLEPTQICQSNLAIAGRCPADQYQHFYHSNLSQAPKLDLAKT